MELSISNIGWVAENDPAVYALMQKTGFRGLEIAPTRIFPERPYDKIVEAGRWSTELARQYGFFVPSMQSIWYGRQEKIFGSVEERKALIEYTKKAIDFAAAINCGNLVFGCPRNRYAPEGFDPETAIGFFKAIGDYAATKRTTIGMEANPPIYNTNYVNDTLSALALIERVDSKGFRLNLDLGTVINNGEDLSEIVGNVQVINHVHISEPGLRPIVERKLHSELREILEKENYRGYVSIEMGKVDDISLLEEKMRYIREIFG